MPGNKPLQAARIVSSVAATCIALACGTNYAFSNWGPQFADRLKLSSTQINLIVRSPAPAIRFSYGANDMNRDYSEIWGCMHVEYQLGC